MSEKTMLEKNLEMWEKFVSGNMDLMFKSMEKAMEGSQALQKQITEAVDKAVKESQTVQEQAAEAVTQSMEGSQELQKQVAETVRSAMSAQFEATLTTLKALERQVAKLSEKVEELAQAQDAE